MRGPNGDFPSKAPRRTEPCALLPRTLPALQSTSAARGGKASSLTPDSSTHQQTDHRSAWRKRVQTLRSLDPKDKRAHAHEQQILSLSPLYYGPNNRLILTDFYRFFRLSWETSLQENLTPEASRHSSLIRPLEELLHKKCSTLRGELDSSAPRVSRVFWSQVLLE